jgi:hypothetical protein
MESLMGDVKLTVRVETDDVVREYAAYEMIRSRVTAATGAGTLVSLANISSPLLLRVVSKAENGEVVTVTHNALGRSTTATLQAGGIYLTEDIAGDVTLVSDTGEPLVDVLAIGS